MTASFDGTMNLMWIALPCCGFRQQFHLKRHEGNRVERKCPKCGVAWEVDAFRQTSFGPGDRFILDWRRKTATPKGIAPRPPTTMH